jgi:hypothetical protein
MVTLDRYCRTGLWILLAIALNPPLALLSGNLLRMAPVELGRIVSATSHLGASHDEECQRATVNRLSQHLGRDRAGCPHLDWEWVNPLFGRTDG